jgi:hypothetical protein
MGQPLKRIAAILVLLGGMAAAASAQVINHPTGFTGQTDLTLSGNSAVNGTAIRLTPATGNQTGYLFSTAQVPVDNFTTQFTFHTLGAVGGMADGMGFCIQRVGPTPTGGGGGGMGYSGMLTSIFIKFDNYSNVSTTQIYQNGAAPADAGSLDMRAAGVDLHSQHDFRVNMNYNGTAIAMTVTDLTTNAVFSTSFTINIPAVIGGATAHVGFTAATGGAVATQEVLDWTYANLPAPTGLTATNGINQVTLNWTASAGAASYTVLRGTTAGGPYPTTVQTGVVGTTYVDTTATNPNTYYYVVQAVSGTLTSLPSNEARGDPLPPPVTALPNTGLQTNENGTTTTFTVRFNTAAPAGGSMVTVTSNDPGEGFVSDATNPTPAASIIITVGAGFTGNIPITVTGIGDSLVDGNITYTISVTATNMAVTIPNVSVTNNDTNVPGITFTRISGLVTDESGGTDTFAVTLNTQPFGFIDLPLASLTAAEVTVSPASLRFTPSGNPTYNPGTGVGDWNVSHVVTLTGVDDAVLDFTIPFTIQTGALQLSNASDNPAYAVDPSDVTGANLDNEAIPTLPSVWGGGGSGGGCGLTGLEAGLALVLALLGRRRRRPA